MFASTYFQIISCMAIVAVSASWVLHIGLVYQFCLSYRHFILPNNFALRELI